MFIISKSLNIHAKGSQHSSQLLMSWLHHKQEAELEFLLMVVWIFSPLFLDLAFVYYSPIHLHL